MIDPLITSDELMKFPIAAKGAVDKMITVKIDDEELSVAAVLYAYSRGKRQMLTDGNSVNLGLFIDTISVDRPVYEIRGTSGMLYIGLDIPDAARYKGWYLINDLLLRRTSAIAILSANSNIEYLVRGEVVIGKDLAELIRIDHAFRLFARYNPVDNDD